MIDQELEAAQERYFKALQRKRDLSRKETVIQHQRIAAQKAFMLAKDELWALERDAALPLIT